MRLLPRQRLTLAYYKDEQERIEDALRSFIFTPLAGGSVLPGGIASVPVTVGLGLQPQGEATGSGVGANGPAGDANDNLTVDFGFYPLHSIGNRVFLDNGAGGGVAPGCLAAPMPGTCWLGG